MIHTQVTHRSHSHLTYDYTVIIKDTNQEQPEKGQLESRVQQDQVKGGPQGRGADRYL
jgi:hypothetical protein